MKPPRWMLALALLAGCGDTGAIVPDYTCKTGECAPQVSAYAVEVTAPESGALPSLEFNNIAFDLESGYFVVGLPDPVSVHGRITSGGAPVDASIVFSRASRIPGRPDVYYQANLDKSTGEYTVLVPPNIGEEQYTVSVRPTDAATYPPVTMQVAVTSETGASALDLPLPSGNDLLVLKGKVLDAIGTAVGDASVVLRDSSSQVAVSTLARTGSNGHFEIAVPLSATASTKSLSLSIERGTSATGLVGISLELTSESLAAQIVTDMSVKLPVLPSPTRFTFRVIGTAPNGVEEPVVGANVRLRASLVETTLVGTLRAYHEYETQLLPEDDGNVTVDLYSNESGSRTYSVAISPSASSEFQTTTTTIDVGIASGVSAPVRLALRPLITGRVLDPMGLPLKGVVVQPSLNNVTVGVAASSVSLATTSKPNTVTTDVDGRFAVRLDPGLYDFGIVPPALSQLPRRWVSSQHIGGDADLGDIIAPRAVSFDGVVQANQAAPVRTSLRLYTVPLSNAVCEAGQSDCLSPPRLQAEGMTNENGRAPLLLPADGT